METNRLTQSGHERTSGSTAWTGPPLRPAHEELGIGLTDLLEADVTLVVGGKGDEPKLELEIELKSGRKVTRPLPDSFFDEKTKRLRPKALADWLHLDEATAVGALRTSNPQAAEFIDEDALATQLGIDGDDPLSTLPITVRRGRPGWTFRVKPPWIGFTRLPLGKVTALATKEKVSDDVAPTLAAATIADDGGAATGDTDTVAMLPLDERDQELLNRGCFGWIADHVALTLAGIGGLVLLLAVAIIVFGGDDSGSDRGSAGSESQSANAGSEGADLLAVDEYADTACGIFADNFIDADDRMLVALTAATKAPVATAELYDEIEAGATDFAEGLSDTSDALAATPAPDVEGGEAAHEQVIDNYNEAEDAAEDIARAAREYDPATATAADTVAVGEAINEGLTAIGDALGAGGDVEEIDDAFAASDVCISLGQ